MTSSDSLERNLGDQPLAAILDKRDLKGHDLVAASVVQLTHKTISRARKGRRLTPNSQRKVLNALNRATGESFTLRDLFNY